MNEDEMKTQDMESIRRSTIELVHKTFDTPVELGTETCRLHLENNPGCNNCFSYHGCCLVFIVLNRVAEIYPDDYHKEGLQSFMAGLKAGFLFGLTGVPETKN